MADEAQQEAFERVQKLLEEAILRDYPNPERIGCPGTDALKRIAFQDVAPTSDPAWQHTIRCAPCYTEFLQLRTDYKARRQKARAYKRYAVGGLAASVLICLVWIFGWTTTTRRSLDEYRDLSQVRTLRGEAESSEPKLTFPAADLNLRFKLPVGSGDGAYELFVIPQSGSKPVANAVGNAVLANGDAILKLKIDLSSIKPGIYELDFRRHGWDWMLLNCRIVPSK
jgi:hypothetical protein